MKQFGGSAILQCVKHYRIYLKYWDTLTPYNTCSNFYSLRMCLKTAGWVANNVDPDQTPRSADNTERGKHLLPSMPHLPCHYFDLRATLYNVIYMLGYPSPYVKY